MRNPPSLMATAMANHPTVNRFRGTFGQGNLGHCLDLPGSVGSLWAKANDQVDHHQVDHSDHSNFKRFWTQLQEIFSIFFFVESSPGGPNWVDAVRILLKIQRVNGANHWKTEIQS